MEQFNRVLLEFLDSLSTVFPEIPALRGYRMLAKGVIASNPSLPANKFLEAVGIHGIKLMQRDATFFDDCPSIIEGVDMRKMWHAPDLSEESRNIIWTYLNSLYMLGAQAVLPPGTMDQVQGLAVQLSQKMQSGEADLSSLCSLLQTQADSVPQKLL